MSQQSNNLKGAIGVPYVLNTNLPTGQTVPASPYFHGVVGPQGLQANQYLSYNGNFGAAAAKPPKMSPKGWVKFDDVIHNGEYQYESPLNGEIGHISSLSISAAIGRFHFGIFTALYPDVEFFVIGIRDDNNLATPLMNTNVSNAIFPKLEEGLFFEAWLAEYQKRFGSRETLYKHRMPPPPKSPITVVTLADEHKLTKDQMAIWFMQNCTHPVYAAGEFFMFESEDDAATYKLKFL